MSWSEIRPSFKPVILWIRLHSIRVSSVILCRAQPAHRWGHCHCWCCESICGVPEEEWKLHTAGERFITQLRACLHSLLDLKKIQIGLTEMPFFSFIMYVCVTVWGSLGTNQHRLRYLPAHQGGDWNRSCPHFHWTAELWVRGRAGTGENIQDNKLDMGVFVIKQYSQEMRCCWNRCFLNGFTDSVFDCVMCFRRCGHWGT